MKNFGEISKKRKLICREQKLSVCRKDKINLQYYGKGILAYKKAGLEFLERIKI